MNRSAMALVLLVSFLLTGCSALLTDEYTWEQTHYIPPAPDSGQELAAADFEQLVRVLSQLVQTGTEMFTVSVANYDRSALENEIDLAVDKVCATDPIAAYAVSDMSCRVGTVAGETVLLVQVNYLHDKNEIDKIVKVADNDAAKEAISAALKACDSGVVLHVDAYQEEDFLLAAELFALHYPQYVMELPQISVNIYPESGISRVLEIRFTYVNSRDALRDMQNQVLTVFDASVNMVSLAGTTREKYQQMYVLMMERFQRYTIETSITPAYSLLLHGVGDARAFAVLYAAMCREANLPCEIVAGTKGGKQWYWNIVSMDGIYYHVDLLRSKGEGNLRFMTDSIIQEGYVWDFSVYSS